MSLTSKTLTLYTIQEVGDALRVHRRTVYRLIHEGRLKAVKVGSQWRVPEAALVEFIEKGGRVASRKKRSGPSQLQLPFEEE